MKNFQKLNRNEMRNVLGGVEQQCYNCTVGYANGSTITGVSCGSSVQDATNNLGTNIENHPAVYGDPSYWSCNFAN